MKTIFTIAICILIVGCRGMYKNQIILGDKTYVLDNSYGSVAVYSEDKLTYLEWSRDTLIVKTYYNRSNSIDTIPIHNH